MFFLIYLMGLAYLFIGGIIGEHYRYTLASIVLFVFTVILYPLDSSALAMGFTALFGIVIFSAVIFLLALVVFGGAEMLKNGLLN